MFHVILYQPDIPQNTGNISRLCVGANCQLHLIKPLGFSLQEKYLRRAGLDHWNDLVLHVHDSLERALEFCNIQPHASEAAHPKLAILSKHGEHFHWEHDFKQDNVLLFGSETKGLPLDFIAQWKSSSYALPIIGPVRSLNLANSVSAVVYEGLRQLSQKGTELPHKRDWGVDFREYFDIQT